MPTRRQARFSRAGLQVSLVSQEGNAETMALSSQATHHTLGQRAPDRDLTVKQKSGKGQFLRSRIPPSGK